MKNIILFLLLLGLFSCNKVSFLPSENSPCITAWVYEESLIGRRYLYVLCFDNTGNYAEYYVDKKTKVIEIDSLNDSYEGCQYVIEGDTILFDGRSYGFECKNDSNLVLKTKHKSYKFKRFNLNKIILPSEDCTKLPLFTGKGFWIESYNSIK